MHSLASMTIHSPSGEFTHPTAPGQVIENISDVPVEHIRGGRKADTRLSFARLSGTGGLGADR